VEIIIGEGEIVGEPFIVFVTVEIILGDEEMVGEIFIVFVAVEIIMGDEEMVGKISVTPGSELTSGNLESFSPLIILTVIQPLNHIRRTKMHILFLSFNPIILGNPIIEQI